MKYKYLIALLFLFAHLKAQPITGEAKKLEFEKDRIIYSGDVKLTRGESVLRADKVIILLNEEG
ncbi:MAG TPA: lipopolysaccharide transport periplasmic protein LptA, partial [Aquificaceae bacterium]|nr:lipopolysaccharide transport periplasmic protein LptA [Aquificaceae bacterium]